MNTEIIGQAAGKVWNELNGNGRMTIQELKAATNLSDAVLYAATGWLAREGKIVENDNSYELV